MAGLLEIDGRSLGDAFGHRSVAVRHSLVSHPLLSLDAIAELADELPPNSVRRERSDLSLVTKGKARDVGSGPPSQTLREIEDNRFRVALREI